MLWTVVLLAALAALLPPVSCSSYSPRLQSWLDSEDSYNQDPEEQATWRQAAKRELGEELMAEKRALSVLSRWKPFTDTFRSGPAPGGYPSRSQAIRDLLPRGVEIVSAETRGSLRPPGQPLRWGRR